VGLLCAGLCFGEGACFEGLPDCCRWLGNAIDAYVLMKHGDCFPMCCSSKHVTAHHLPYLGQRQAFLRKRKSLCEQAVRRQSLQRQGQTSTGSE